MAPSAQSEKDAIAPDAEVDAALRGLFGRDAAYLSLWAVQIVWGALFTPITSRLLGAREFGISAAAMAVMQILVALAGFGMQTAVQRVFSSDGDRAARNTMAASVLIATVLCAAAFAAGPLWAPLLGLGSFSAVLRETVVWGWLTAITSAGLGLLRSRDRLLPFATATLMQSAGAEAVGLTFVLAIRASAAEYILGIVLAQAVAAICVIAATRPLWPDRSARPLLMRSVRFGAGLVPAALAQFVFDASDRLVVHGDLGAVATARYSVARNIGGLTIVLLTLVNNVWMPRVFALDRPSLLQSVMRQSRDLIYLILVPLILGLGAISPYVLSLWVPPSYHPLGLQLVLSIVSISACFAATGASATRLLLQGGRTTIIGVLTAAAAAVNLVLNLILVPRWGLNGSALASLVSFLLLGAALTAASRRQAVLGRPGLRLLVALASGVAGNLLLSQAPTWGAFIAIRGLIAIGSTLMLVAVLASVIRPERVPRIARLIRSIVS